MGQGLRVTEGEGCSVSHCRSPVYLKCELQPFTQKRWKTGSKYFISYQRGLILPDSLKAFGKISKGKREDYDSRLGRLGQPRMSQKVQVSLQGA